MQKTQRLGFDPWVRKIPWNGNPLHYSCLGNPKIRGACWVTVHRVTKSWTWLFGAIEQARMKCFLNPDLHSTGKKKILEAVRDLFLKFCWMLALRWFQWCSFPHEEVRTKDRKARTQNLGCHVPGPCLKPGFGDFLCEGPNSKCSRLCIPKGLWCNSTAAISMKAAINVKEDKSKRKSMVVFQYNFVRHWSWNFT